VKAWSSFHNEHLLAEIKGAHSLCHARLAFSGAGTHAALVCCRTVDGGGRMIRAQFLRFVAVGFTLNAALYAGYLLLTWKGIGHEAAMTITFCLGTLLSFIANRNFTFRYSGNYSWALLRFLECYIILYMLNFVGLWFFVGRLGIAHQIVQGGAVLVIALLAFLLQRYWVFCLAADRMAPVAGNTER
jgi:putative flippase GtrA